MSFNVGGAEAARRAGYSANGAKQRGAFLMRQPEIRIRVDEIRTARCVQHQAHLDEADEQVGWVIEDAFETKRPALALRAIEFRLKLRGVIQDKRIAHHHHGALDSRPHPDADLESLPGDPEEDLDPIRFRPGFVPEPAAEPIPSATPEPEIEPETEDDPALSEDDLMARIVTNGYLSAELARVTAHFAALKASTAPASVPAPFPASAPAPLPASPPPFSPHAHGIPAQQVAAIA
ncbi:hypothetical protein N825_25705 [Skermanella stibiiresistens SB22]|uniref:Terminase n=2 Tax=Skermanella TaxID=204447 RepID=W9GS61_9PROT|nr:hypothetical protein N825_25705 [Skermanella stibiiresistens SB22]